MNENRSEKNRTDDLSLPLDEAALLQTVKDRIENPDLLFHGGMGMRVTLVQAGYVEAEVVLEPRHANPIGSIHGGLLLTLADNVGGAAAATYGYLVTTSSCSFNFLRTDPDAKKIIAKAEVVKRGKRLCVSEVKIFDEKGTLFCMGLFEYAVLGLRAYKETS